jgi:hypothetical protein
MRELLEDEESYQRYFNEAQQRDFLSWDEYAQSLIREIKYLNIK